MIKMIGGFEKNFFPIEKTVFIVSFVSVLSMIKMIDGF